MTTTARWPCIELVRAPQLAGLGPGDLLVLELDRPILIRLIRQYEHRRRALCVSTVSEPSWGPALRATARGFESTAEISERPTVWRPDESPAPQIDGAEVRLIEDGPCLGIPRTIDGRVLVQPRYLDANQLNTMTRWTGSNGERLVEVGVYERWDGTWQINEYPRIVGVSYRALASACGGTLDPERAAAIALCHRNQRDPRSIGFDGAVRDPSGDVVPPDFGDVFVFTALCGSFGDPREDWVRFDSVAPASTEAVAQLVRELFPFEWAREQQFLAECAVVFGDVVRDGGRG